MGNGALHWSNIPPLTNAKLKINRWLYSSTDYLKKNEGEVSNQHDSYRVSHNYSSFGSVSLFFPPWSQGNMQFLLNDGSAISLIE